MATTISYNGRTIHTVSGDETLTLPTNNKIMTGDLVFDTDGDHLMSVNYGGNEIINEDGAGTHTMKCGQTIMQDDVTGSFIEVLGGIQTVSGNDSITLNNAAARPLLNLTQEGAISQSGTPTPSTPQDLVCNNGTLKIRHESGLPSGYMLLDEVHNNSNTIINTGIIDDVDDLRIELRVKPTTGSWYIAQSRASTNGPIYGISGSGTGNTILFNNGSASSLSSGIVRDTSHTYTVIGEHRNGVISLYVKDETTGAEDTKTETYATADFTAATTRIGIWSNGANNASSGNTIYHLRIYKSGVLVADYVPCQYNNENGFYDFVSGSFKGATNGSIYAGTAVTDPVEVYIDGIPEVITLGEQTASAEILFAVGDYADTQDIISGAVTRKVGVKVFDGTETITKVSGVNVYRYTQDDAGFDPDVVIDSSHFQGVASKAYTAAGMPNLSIKGHSSNTYFYFRDDTITSSADFKAWLAAQYAAGTPVIVLYPLATPTTETVTPQPITLGDGTNIIDITANVSPIPISATYRLARSS